MGDEEHIVNDFSRDLRIASRCVDDKSPLVNVFYHLMRDHVPVGVLTEVVSMLPPTGTTVQYTNGHLADFARHLAGVVHERSYYLDT